MNNPFPYSLDNKRYHTLYYYNMKKYGERVYKAPIDAGFTCPNIANGKGGCIYCSDGGGYFTSSPSLSVMAQLEAETEKIIKKHQGAKIIAYFQSHTNTFADADTVRKRILPVLDNPLVKGVSIATRADCLPEDILQLLEEINRKTDLTVELGLQTVHNSTAELINRGLSYNQFCAGFNSLRDRRIRVTLHIINGLPGENPEMMLETAKMVGSLKPDGLKIHLLHVIRGTKLADLYLSGNYIPMEKEEYVEITAEQLRYIPAETVIERITGDGDKNTLLAPLWSRNKISVLGAIDRYMLEKDIFQGDMV